ncbi:hypothetical protein Tco_0251663 [Tanacetum coccineum]
MIGASDQTLGLLIAMGLFTAGLGTDSSVSTLEFDSQETESLEANRYPVNGEETASFLQPVAIYHTQDYFYITIPTVKDTVKTSFS